MDNYNGIIDDDPALDVIMIEEMEKEGDGPQGKKTQGQGNGGCLSLVLFMLIPPVSIYMLLNLIT